MTKILQNLRTKTKNTSKNTTPAQDWSLVVNKNIQIEVKPQTTNLSDIIYI